MKYDFDEIIERRGTNALNTDGFRGYIFKVGPEATFNFADDEFVRMWVADMEFACAPPILDALRGVVDQRIFGYTMSFDGSYEKAFAEWCMRRYNWQVPVEELTYSAGIIPALFQLVELLVQTGEQVITFTPAYSQFQNATNYNHVELVSCPLENQQGQFTIDFELFETQAASPQAKLVILSNPHNPTGRVWTEEELRQIGQVVEKYNLWLISDEIHCDLLRRGQTFTPMAKIMPDYQKLITCMAPSKTFNLAGIMLSDIIIRDQTLRETFKQKDKAIGMLNPFSLAAHKAAFLECDDWLEELKDYLDDNFSFVKAYLSEHLPKAIFEIPQSTYLAWVNLNAYLPDVEDMALFFANQAGVLLESGDSLFVHNAEGFIRLNLAMPQSLIRKGLDRITAAVLAES